MKRLLVGIIGAAALLSSLPASAAPMVPARPAFHVTTAQPEPLVRQVQYYGPRHGVGYPHRTRAYRHHHRYARHHRYHHAYAHRR